MRPRDLVLTASCLLAALALLGCCLPADEAAQEQTPSRWDKKPQEPDNKPDNKPRPDEGERALSQRGNTKIATFDRAKDLLLELHRDNAIDLYCACRYDQQKQVDHKSCGYKVRKDATRARRIEYEHIVPASVFGQKMPGWSEGDPQCERNGKPYKGRDCAARTSEVFRYMEADLYNLQPVVGEVNGDRGNLPMGIIPGEPRAYGACDVEIVDGLFEPRPEIRGDIARTYKYMDWAYPDFGIMESVDRAMIDQWDKADPVDNWERERAERIAKVQGNRNPFIK
jgi:deoxyribonuclease-1